MTDDRTITDALAKLREPFAPNHISKLPKPTKAQTEAVRADFKKGVRCKDCGAWHHPDVTHLDYVGHAALTDRLLDTDINWSWEPAAVTVEGLPAFDGVGGLWIKLTVCGVTRLGYGNAAQKPNQDSGNREKEVIGDALRNAAMRFGAALDLWHKGDLHADDDATAPTPQHDPTPAISEDQRRQIMALGTAKSADTRKFCEAIDATSVKAIPAAKFNDAMAWLNALPVPGATSSNPQSSDVLSDEIPY